MNLALATPRVQAIEASEGYWRSVLRRFLKDKVAVGAAIVIIALLLTAVFAHWVAPNCARSARRASPSAPTSSAATCSPASSWGRACRC